MIFLAPLFAGIIFAAFAGVGAWPARGLLGKPVASRFDWLMAISLGSLLSYFAIDVVGAYRFTPGSMFATLGALLIFAGLGLRFHCEFQSRNPRLPTLDSSEKVMLLVLGGISLIFLIFCLAPPADYDSLNYHLSLAKLDLEQQKIKTLYGFNFFSYVPRFVDIFYRLALILWNDRAAQSIHAIYGILCGVAVFELSLKIGADRKTSLLAALLFFGIRCVIFEAGTCFIDLGLTFYVLCALLAMDHWLKDRKTGNFILIGLLLGILILIKYHGLVLVFCFTLALFLLSPEPWIRRIRIAWIPVIAAAVALPFFWANARDTGNPFFPLLNPLFSKELRDFGLGVYQTFGEPRSWTRLIPTFFKIFLLPSQLFDGQQIGAPYLLVLAPFYWFRSANAFTRLEKLMAAFALSYYVIWYWKLTNQVRFLLPIFPVLAIWAARGFFHLSKFLTLKPLRFVFYGACALFALNQLMFLGIHSAIRLPAALGFMSAERYFQLPHGKVYFYEICRKIERELAADEKYISLSGTYNYYCPQLRAIYDYFPSERWKQFSAVHFNDPLSKSELISQLTQEKVKYLLVPTRYENRSNESAAPIIEKSENLEFTRIGKVIREDLQKIQPVMTDYTTALYLVPDLLKVLRAQK